MLLSERVVHQCCTQVDTQNQLYNVYVSGFNDRSTKRTNMKSGNIIVNINNKHP